MSREDITEAMNSAPRGRVGKTFYIGEDVIERVNGTVQWARMMAIANAAKEGITPDQVDLSGLPETAAELVESALWAEVLKLERRVNEGEPFPKPQGRLKTGPSSRGRERLRQPRRNPHE